MGARISTIQRQARELGRLRTGVYEATKGGRGAPSRSKTWIITSPDERQVEAAAAEWGGEAEKWQPQGAGAPQFRVITEASSIEALLPPGDPVSQSFESWSKGGVQRRCDGTSEAIKDCPCICRATWGDDFHQVAPRDAACKMTTRLNVILPTMPDMGVFRVETHSFYSANEITASVDIIRAAVGPEQLIPVNLRIEPRTKVAQGKTKQFPVVVVELRGVTSGQLLTSLMYGAKPNEIEMPAAHTAIEARTRNYLALAQDATTLEEWREIWRQASAAGYLDDEELRHGLGEAGKALAAHAPAPVEDADALDAEAVESDAPTAGLGATLAHEHESAFESDCDACRADAAEADRALAGDA
jgi:hypothetical protein